MPLVSPPFLSLPHQPSPPPWLLPHLYPPLQPLQAETRQVDPTTGAEKGQKLARFDLIPAGPLRQLAEHFGRGSQKYADRNWEKGMDWSLPFAALQRHAWAFWQGEDTDPETGSAHMAAVAWHAFALLEYMETYRAGDNRPPPPKAPANIMRLVTDPETDSSNTLIDMTARKAA